MMFGVVRVCISLSFSKCIVHEETNIIFLCLLNNKVFSSLEKNAFFKDLFLQDE